MLPNDRFHSDSQPLEASEAIASDRPLEFDLEIELDALEKSIVDGTHIPLTEYVVLDRVVFLYQLNKIRNNLPSDLATAVEIANHKQQIILEAQHYADSVVRSAKEKADRILQDSTILRQAELDGAKVRLKTERECDELKQQTWAEVEQLRQSAIAQSQAIQIGADEYADSVLKDIEQKLQQMLGIIHNGRQQLDTTNSDFNLNQIDL